METDSGTRKKNKPGFVHSIKVPTQYKRAALIFKNAIEKKKSLKSLIYEEKHAKIDKLFPLFQKYNDNMKAIENAITETKILEDNKSFNPYLCRVLITDLFFLTQKLNGESRPVKTVLEYQEKLSKYLNENKFKRENKPSFGKPRYIRVNTNLFSIDEAIQYFEREGFYKCNYDENDYDDYLRVIKELKEEEYAIDIHIPELFIFSSLTRKYWATNEYVEKKKFALQDKATCLVAKLLNPPENSIILDMCAAPGMKTIHLSNLIRNSGTIFAVERNIDRYNVLVNMVKSSDAKCVKTINDDALQLNLEDFTNVEYIVVDPPCSGSGMQNRLTLGTETKDEDRLWKLAGLQIKLLQSALSNFPNVKKVIYSTCSLYPEENEVVVQTCLQRCQNFKLLNIKKDLRKMWKNTGDTKYKGIGKHCLYSLPEIDKTDGIFIALFERKKEESDYN
ncbi:28S rRNA (cytosine-C(5))-methyltransferase [Condylostylus longicornis]|uniref:28S rRNA (cytosine-C(5))-methyltransferase n=1 Tax=Condylostylus longicornis TaxID=2530218 RepID=UPI00244E2A2E|nr:28S rRNA (cytosine-C(5))-methyltransferase [Condylostylus longicornis]